MCAADCTRLLVLVDSVDSIRSLIVRIYHIIGNMSETVAVWGASGNAGRELVGILEDHPEVGEIEKAGRRFPKGIDHIETAFLALPHGESAKIAARLKKTGRKVIDLSGDLRFSTPEEYERWYDIPHPAPDLLPVPYALPEWDTGQIESSELVAMPGCYPTATLLGINPLVQAGVLAHEARIQVNAVSGFSGRGNQPMPEVQYGNLIPYAVGRQHRHVGEMELFTLGHEINFAPSTIDQYRGMLVTITAQLATKGICDEMVHGILEDEYRDDDFVAVLDDGELPTFKTGAGTDMCYIGATADNCAATIVSAIDNLRKGAASQAVQVFNRMHGYDEAMGLTPNQPAEYTTSCR